jgi:hypothetical protein
MELHRFTPDMIDRAIDVLNAGFYDGKLRFDMTRKRKMARSQEWRILGVLRTRDGKSPGARPSPSGRRTIAVDWQTHYDFMEQLFVQLPTGRIRTSLIGTVDYDGITAFYFTCGQNRGRIVGSQAKPSTFGALVGHGR